MILSAMMFALGVMTSGLAWLVFCVLLVRRTRALTERRLIASLAVTRTEFVTERDELRARQAVEMYRLEREVSRSLDMATAYRLESDVKEIDVAGLRADLSAREEEIAELTGRFATAQTLNQELERRVAETATALRTAQHQLRMEAVRRGGVEDSLEEAGALGQQRRAAMAALERENEALREALGSPAGLSGSGLAGSGLAAGLGLAGAGEAGGETGARLPRILLPQNGDAPALAGNGGGSVVQLPARPRVAAEGSLEETAAVDPSERVAGATRELQRLAGAVTGSAGSGGESGGGVGESDAAAIANVPANDADLPELVAERNAGADGKRAGRRAGASDRKLPTASFGSFFGVGRGAPEPVVADLSSHRAATNPDRSGAAGPAAATDDKGPPDGKAESRFFRALAEIRALKSSAGPAAE